MKWLWMILLAPSLAFAGGPRSTFPQPPGMDAEINNIYHDIANPVINIGSASTMTITQLNVSTITAINVVVSSLVANNFTATTSTFTALKVTGTAVIPWMTDWKSDLTFVPDATAFGTISNSDFKYRRVGDSMEVMFYFKSGTVTANTAKIALPNGITIDTSKITGSRKAPLGWAHSSTGAGGQGNFTLNVAAPIFYDSTGGSGVVTLGVAAASDATTGMLVPVNATIWNNNGQLGGRFTIPVTGWTTNN